MELEEGIMPAAGAGRAPPAGLIHKAAQGLGEPRPICRTLAGHARPDGTSFC